MRRLFDFKCPNGHITEELVESETAIQCSCGLEAKRILSPIRCQLEGLTGHFPGAHIKWAKKHEQAAKLESAKAES